MSTENSESVVYNSTGTHPPLVHYDNEDNMIKISSVRVHANIQSDCPVASRKNEEEEKNAWYDKALTLPGVTSTVSLPPAVST